MNSPSQKYLHVQVTLNGNELYTCGFDESEIMIGRGGDCQVLLENAGVSRNHAKLLREGDQITVVDLLSGNGTFVNGEQIETAVICEGDTLRIGKFTLFVKLSTEVVSQSSQPQWSAGGEINSGTVFLRPEERNKILKQAEVQNMRASLTIPTNKQSKTDWTIPAVFFILGLLFGFVCGRI